MDSAPHEGAQVSPPEPVRRVMAVLRERGHGAWLVGGCVRDSLLGREVHDWDLATSAKPKQVSRLFPRVIPTGIDHGTVTVLQDDEPIEVTTLRGEGAYTDGRRPDEVFFVSDIEEDLARRDFTVNGMAVDGRGAMVDPFGGLEDLASRTIRAVGDPLERFTEDGLRVLRGARFVATLECELDAKTEAAFGPTLPIFRKVSPERVRDEWLKTMKAQRPSRAFAVMKRTGLLAACCEPLDGLDDQDWRASLSALDRCELSGAERLGALFHRVPVAAVDDWLKAYRFSNAERKVLVGTVTAADAPLNGSDEALRRWLAPVRPMLDAALGVVRAVHEDDGEAFGRRVRAMNPSALTLNVGDLEVRGEDVKAAGAQGRAIGEVLRTLLDEVLTDPTRGSRTTLLARIQELMEDRA
ncbi:MAG: hypothetical protein AAF938_19605 [Myxococcota bacterium]